MECNYHQLVVAHEELMENVSRSERCVVCFDSRADCIVLPCMHLCLCRPCGQRLSSLGYHMPHLP
jgi:hypothetical protein